MIANDAVTKLENARIALDTLKAEMQTLIDKAIPPEVKAAIADIEDEFAPAIAEAEANYSSAEAEAKSAVIAYGSTVKGNILQVVFAKGRVTWDAKALDGYAMENPELFAFRKESDPSASVRSIK